MPPLRSARIARTATAPALAVALVLAACSSGTGTLELVIDGARTFDGVARLDVLVVHEAARATASFSPTPPITIGPNQTQSLALVTPRDRSGEVTITVTASNAAGTPLATGLATATMTPGETVTVPVTLGSPMATGDMAVVDGAPRDSPALDLVQVDARTADAPPVDATQPDASTPPDLAHDAAKPGDLSCQPPDQAGMNGLITCFALNQPCPPCYCAGGHGGCQCLPGPNGMGDPRCVPTCPGGDNSECPNDTVCDTNMHICKPQ